MAAEERTGAAERVAFVGVGVMGRPMARNLAASGTAVVAFDARTEALAGLSGTKALAAASLAEAAAGATVAITMLPDAPDVRAVLFGEGGLAALLAPGALVIDMSTIAPSAARAMAEQLAARGLACLDAPVSGGPPGAEAATLSIMAGGAADAFARAEPLLRAMGTTVRHVGPSGAGQVFKACNQLMVASHIQAMCEALALGRAEGADATLLVEVLRKGAAGSWMLDNLAPKILAGDASAGFRIDLMLKDLRIAGEAAFASATPLPGLALATQLYLEARAHGEGGNGNQALFRTYERLAGGG